VYRLRPSNRAFVIWFGGLLLANSMAAQAATVVSPEPPTPDDGNTFGFYVGDKETFDSNLFRVPPALEATLIGPNTSRQDYLNESALGGDGQYIAGRQIFDADFQIDDTRFAHNSSLDDVSGFGKLTWDWAIASLFSGQFQATYDRSLASFAEAIFYGRDLVVTQDYYGQGNYQIGPHWAVFGDIRETSYSHGAAPARFNDYRATSGSAGLEYAAGPDDSIRVEYRYTDAYYPSGYIFNDAEIDRDYRQSTARLLFKHSITDKTSIEAYAGYLERDYTEAQLGKFSGDIWRVTLDWKPTDKTDLVFAGWHELHAYAVSEADYFVSRGGSITPGWTVTEKLTLSTVFSFEDQDYIASSNSVLLVGSRTDRVTGEQLNLLYQPRGNLLLNFFVRNEDRKSNVQRFQYNDLLANASITFRFW